MTVKWRGIHKLTEECGEVLQLLGKLGAFPDGNHPDEKGNLIDRLEGEITDLYVALNYFASENGLNIDQTRYQKKLKLFREWKLSGIKDAR